MGGCIYPIEKDKGYAPAFATAANITSAPTGLLISPTSAFIVCSTVAGGVSISTLFMAGHIPGILMGLGSMVVAFAYAKKHKYPTTGIPGGRECLRVTLRAIPCLLLILIVIGGIVGGIFTATEGAGICVLYSLILSICHKNITFKSFIDILVKSACTSGIILLIVGMFMDITPAILIFTPIFLPIAEILGMSNIQFCAMLIFNMCMGNITPPVGAVLFVGCGISKISIGSVTKTLLPYFGVLFLLVTRIPVPVAWDPSRDGLDLRELKSKKTSPRPHEGISLCVNLLTDVQKLLTLIQNTQKMQLAHISCQNK